MADIDYTGNVLLADALTVSSITEENETAPSLLNSWVNFGGALADAAYFKDKEGIVHIRGTIKSGTTTDDTTLFTLPSGYRPSAQQNFPVVSNGAFAVVVVKANGNVCTSGTVSATYISLAGITFRAA